MCYRKSYFQYPTTQHYFKQKGDFWWLSFYSFFAELYQFFPFHNLPNFPVPSQRLLNVCVLPSSQNQPVSLSSPWATFSFFIPCWQVTFCISFNLLSLKVNIYLDFWAMWEDHPSLIILLDMYFHLIHLIHVHCPWKTQKQSNIMLRLLTGQAIF